MQTAKTELGLSNVKINNGLNIPLSQLRKFIEQLLRRLTGDQGLKGKPVKWIEWACILAGQDHSNAWNPVGCIREHQMTDHIERAERSRLFSAIEPRAGFFPQQCVHDAGCR